MSTTQTSVLSDRNGITVLKGVLAQATGPQSESFSLPSGFGDCVIYTVALILTPQATAIANPELYTHVFYVGDSLARDYIAAPRWTKYTTTGIALQFELYCQALWRAAETLSFLGSAMDTNGVPTGTYELYAKVMRLRNLGAPP